MDNIFENAKLGDKFVMKNGKIAVYHKKSLISGTHYLICEDLYELIPYKANGFFGDDEWNIVGKYQEQIDNGELNNLCKSLSSEFSDPSAKFIWESGFKVGFRTAKNN